MLEFFSQNEKPKNLNNNDEVAKYFTGLIPHPVTRSIVFNCKLKGDFEGALEDLRCDLTHDYLGGYDLVASMKRLTSLAFITVFSCWCELKKMLQKHSDIERSEFQKTRYSRIFESVLKREEITYDLEIFSLIEVWVALKKGAMGASIFGAFFSNLENDFGITLQKALGMMKEVSFKETSGAYSELEVKETLCQLIEGFVFLRTLAIDYRNEFTLSCMINFNRKTFAPNSIFPNMKFILSQEELLRIRARQDGAPLEERTGKKKALKLMPYLMVANSDFNGKKQSLYRAFDDTVEVKIDLETEEYVTMAELNKRDADLEALRKVLSFDYKNLRSFALVISDSLNQSHKQYLFEICKNKYPTILPNISDSQSEAIYWDNVITLLLVEIGPSDFLYSIMSDDLYEQLMRNMAYRCIDRNLKIQSEERFRAEIAELKKVCGTKKAMFEHHKKLLQCNFLIQMTGLKSEEEKTAFSPFEESLMYKFDRMQNSLRILGRTNLSLEDCNAQKENLSECFRNIFLMLQIFYEGLDSYAEAMRSSKANATRAEMHESCKKAFISAAKKKYYKIKDLSLSKMYDKFYEMCIEYNTTLQSEGFNVSEKARNLKCILTRNYICDVGKLNYFASIVFDDGTESNLFAMLEDIDKYTKQKNYEKWLGYFKDFFMFLIYNDDYMERGIYENHPEQLMDKDYDPIYPYVVFYYQENIDKDHLKKCNYRVPIPCSRLTEENKNEGFMVTLLTDNEYTPNGNYFCIPLKYGSTEDWWINPFMISTQEFAEIMD